MADALRSERSLVVVPCFDEADRLQGDRFRAFLATAPDIDFLFVNDGSGDATLARLQALAAQDEARLSVLDLQPNRGKAEAVRQGMLAAFERGPRYAGYWDADLATPLDEIPRFIEVLETRPERLAVFGARVQLLGRSIQRKVLRHYLGRVFATLVSRMLDLPVYDTQCGAKLFRVTPTTTELFREPFRSSWIFDVEVAARLTQAARREGLPPVAELIYELPLRRWHDIAGSKIRPSYAWRVPLELARIRHHYLRDR